MQRARKNGLPDCPDDLTLIDKAMEQFPEFADYYKGSFTSRKKGEHGVVLMSNAMQQVRK